MHYNTTWKSLQIKLKQEICAQLSLTKPVYLNHWNSYHATRCQILNVKRLIFFLFQNTLTYQLNKKKKNVILREKRKEGAIIHYWRSILQVCYNVTTARHIIQRYLETLIRLLYLLIRSKVSSLTYLVCFQTYTEMNTITV